jgi:hypothetical protein
VLAHRAPPRALGRDAHLRRLVEQQGAGDYRLELVGHRGDHRGRQLRGEVFSAGLTVAEDDSLKQPEHGDARRLHRGDKPPGDAVDAEARRPVAVEGDPVSEISQRARLPADPFAVCPFARARESAGIDARKPRRRLLEGREIEHPCVKVQEWHEPAVVGLDELACKHASGKPQAGHTRAARLGPRLHTHAEVIAQHDEAVDDAPVPRNKRERRDGRIGNLHEVERPESPQGPAIRPRKGTVGGDIAEVIVLGSESLDPGDSRVEELPPTLEIQVLGEPAHRSREGADAAGLREGSEDRRVGAEEEPMVKGMMA